MRYGSVCSGIEAATVAWHPLGWKPSFFSEIDKFPRAVLEHHYPHVPLHGDFTTIRGDEYEPIDLLVGGTPCQSFSIAGLRGGLDDARGNLALAFLQLARRTRARWLVWENVPGVLSSNGGRDFGSILGGMVELGYGIAYRVLDAQFFGVPQRRRRVFVVGYLGDWRRAAAVLFERESLRGDPAPRRKTREGIAPTISARPTGGGGLGTDFDLDGGLISHALRGEGFDASEDETGRGTPLVPVAFNWQSGGSKARIGYDPSSGTTGTLQVGQVQAVALRGREGGATAELSDVPSALRASGGGGDKAHVLAASMVRRLTPRECCRLQGFPDDYLDITYRGKPAADGPKYKALGNSMAVPVMSWIGQRIQAVENITQEKAA